MTPNTCKHNSQLADGLATYMKYLNLNENNEIEVIILFLKNIGLPDKVRFLQKNPTKIGLLAIWDYWYKKSTPSTITLPPAKLKLTDKPCIQTSPHFVDTVKIIQQRHVSFSENIWSITNETVKVLHHKFLNENPVIKISYGTFFALKLFHVRPATTRLRNMLL